MKAERIPMPHPGETLLEDFMKPLALSCNRVARDIGVEPITINLLVKGKRNISPELALRLARYVGTSKEFWLNLQEHYDLRVAEQKFWKKIEREVKPLP